MRWACGFLVALLGVVSCGPNPAVERAMFGPGSEARVEPDGPAPAIATVRGRRFRPPDAAARAEAIGDISALPPAHQRAFADGPLFRPMFRPGRDDWLAQHHERGQSFEAFERRWRPDPARTKIYVLPVGKFGPTDPALGDLERITEAHFAMDVVFLDPVTEEDLALKGRKHGGHRQLHAFTILHRLKLRVPDDAQVLLAVTNVDLYPEPSWNFVFGLASLGERVAVFSFARYHPSFYGEPVEPDTPQRVLTRAVKVMTHELGHTFGMEHCTHFACNMNGSNHLDETDRAPLHLCPVCLRKLQHAVGFDPERRYRDLADAYEATGLDEASTWSLARAAAVAEPG